MGSAQLDLEHIRRFTGDDDALVSEVLSMFVEQTGLWLAALDPSGDDESWSGVAHALKGSAASLGAGDLSALCQRAEDTVGEANAPGVRAFLADEIAAKIDDLKAEIQRWEYAREMRRLKAG